MTNLGKVAIGTGGGVTTAAAAGGTYVALSNKDNTEDSIKKVQSQDESVKDRVEDSQEEEERVVEASEESISSVPGSTGPEHREGVPEIEIRDIEDDSDWTAPFYYSVDGSCTGVFENSSLDLFKAFLEASQFSRCIPT